MKIAVLSDLHIGSIEFEGNRPGFDGFLDHLESKNDRIILAGDIFELNYPRFPFTPYRKFRQIREDYRDITERFFHPPYTILAGNHDWILSRKGFPGELTMEEDGMNIYITHGDICDPNYSSPFRSWFSRSYMWVAWQLKEAGLSLLYDLGIKLDKRLNMDDDSAYREFARGKIRAGYHLVVMGHTHVERDLELESGRYINTGDCLARKMYLSVDTKTGNAELKNHRDR
jgi:UDP-2,3-diacylglucosamine pyrophosphatase LpxH